jgi:uncharacterized protein (DUF2267 family)
MMEKQIVQMIQEKAGISEEQATMALDTVLGFLKDKLPEPIAGQLDAVLKGGSADMLGQLSSLAGGLFGKKE